MPLAVGLSFAAVMLCAVVMVIVLLVKRRRHLQRQESRGKYLLTYKMAIKCTMNKYGRCILNDCLVNFVQSSSKSMQQAVDNL